ncbi:S46 family peptidase [Bacteroidales bacterium AH-315-I05]|nr:S46 family peptidase [Bacteroidales bacterium AH-315-I05]
MFRKIILTVFSIFIAFVFRAEEGMWIPLLLKQLNEGDMQSMGMKLTAEDLYSINKSSLKDAIVHFGGGCTSEIVSPDGLLLTNHHCGYYQIQSHSSVENDYLTNGFWAMNRKEELPNQGLTATFIVKIENVTDRILHGVKESMEEKERNRIIKENSEKIKKVEEAGTHYKCVIKPFYYGNEYYMFITETFKDVRLVGAPPSSIGKYGGDTDNWMWPRHTGDFSVFRIYADSSNMPAEYSENNVPYKPKHFFPISLKGVNEGDFTIVYGFPGRTEQYLTSYAVDYVLNKSNPAKISMRDTSLAIIQKAMKQGDELRIKYSAKQARISNYHKKWEGESRGLKRLNAIEKKQDLEAKFSELAKNNPAYAGKYDDLLFEFESLYKLREKYALSRDYYIELVYYGTEIIRYANGFKKTVEMTKRKDLTSEDLKDKGKLYQKNSEKFFKDYDLETDKKLFISLMRKYYADVEPTMQPPIFNMIELDYNGDFNAYANFIYGKSKLVKKESVDKLLKKFGFSSVKKLGKDPAYLLMESVVSNYYLNVKPVYDSINDEIERLNRDYIRVMRELMPDYRKYYPDANSTLRVTYGKVEGYVSKDDEPMKYYTNMDGLMSKAIPNDGEFHVNGKMTELFEKKDYGRYGKDGELVICFIASNHTTGGNSGSPVLDGEGNLIGINFDRSWESTMSDIMYDPEKCRNIAVDIRYVLWVMDKYAGAVHLVEEMKVVE